MQKAILISAAGLFFAVVHATYTVHRLHRLLESKSPALPDDEVADVAIILGYALFRNGSLTEPLKGRVRAGVDLFKQGRVRHLLFSGSHPGGVVVRRSEANVMREYATGLLGGRPAAEEVRDRWVEEEGSTSTLENAVYSLDMCRDRGWRKLVVVTSPFHQLRSELVFRKLVKAFRREGGGDLHFEVYMARTDFVPHAGYPLGAVGNRLVDLWDLVREVLALAYYTAKRRLL